jgi:hypothetical protein
LADRFALEAEQPLDDVFGSLIASFAEVVVADDAVCVDEVELRPSSEGLMRGGSPSRPC